MQITTERSALETDCRFELNIKPTVKGKSPDEYKKAQRGFYTKEFVEFTLAIGCPVQCDRFCPQEVLIKKYGNSQRMMSFETFKQILSHIPTSVDVDFAGFCEPFVNPDFVKMAEYAYNSGYKLHVNTTLLGAKTSDIERLLKLEYTEFCLHLRDGEVVKFPLTPEYEHNVFKIIGGLPNVTFSVMNKLFETNQREDVTRGILPAPKKVGFCQKLVTPQFIVLPNGMVQLCCMDFALQNLVGNLLTEDYITIKNRLKAKKSVSPLCQYCYYATPYTTHLYKRVVTNGKKIIRQII